RDARGHRRGEHRDAVPPRAVHAALVFLAEHPADGAGADRGGRDHGVVAAQPRQQIRLPAVLPDAGAVRAVLCRARHQHVSLYRAAEHHDLAGGGAGEQPDLHAVWRRHTDPADPRLYRLGLLGVSRQGQTRERISLMPTEPKPRPLLQRLLWFVTLWLGGVGTVALISFCLRL